MSNKYSGGCDHIHTHSDAEPIDNHTCHCSVCKRVTGQPTTHVVFFRHGDVDVDNLDGLNRQPFNDQNPDGPLENAGYVASEEVSGTLAGRAGTFVLQHWGVAGRGAPPRTAGHVVPGSGTGELSGLSGTMEIHVDAGGAHTLALDFEIV